MLCTHFYLHPDTLNFDHLTNYWKSTINPTMGKDMCRKRTIALLAGATNEVDEDVVKSLRQLNKKWCTGIASRLDREAISTYKQIPSPEDFKIPKFCCCSRFLTPKDKVTLHENTETRAILGFCDSCTRYIYKFSMVLDSSSDESDSSDDDDTSDDDFVTEDCSSSSSDESDDSLSSESSEDDIPPAPPSSPVAVLKTGSTWGIIMKSLGLAPQQAV